MIRISKKVEYGLIALRHMERCAERLVSARELSRHYGLSAALTAKILQALTHSGILTSEQGTKGGYRLSRDLRSVSYLEVQAAILGDESDEAGRHERCDLYDRCVVLAPVDNLERRVRQLLATTTVAELFAGERDDCCRVNGETGDNASPPTPLAYEARQSHNSRRARSSVATRENQ